MPSRPSEPPVQHIVVAGGGTAGWMTALLLTTSTFGARLKVTVLDAAEAPIVGAAEGSTPWLRGLFDSLGIDESEWMPTCDATYKCGTTFDGWSTRPGCERFFEPFPSTLDKITQAHFLRNVHARLGGADVHAHPDRFCLSQRVAVEGRAPHPAREFPFDIGYGYHVDGARLAAFLQARALQRGVAHVARRLQAATLDEHGDLRALQLEGGDSLAADLFIDCTGPDALLIGQALKRPFVSYADALSNDAIVTLAVPHGDGPLMSQTVATALRHGWASSLPLASRLELGYVYSSAHASADAAETELRARLGGLDAAMPAHHSTLRAGRHARHWHRNCVAIGAAQGSVEPLQATALESVQRAAASLVDVLERGDLGESARAAFNDGLNARADGVRDLIVARYKTSTRTDTDYWRANAANNALSDRLQALLRTWMSAQPIAPGIDSGSFGIGGTLQSWYSLLAGVGLFPEVDPARRESGGDLDGIDDLIRRGALNFPDQRAWLRDIPPHADRLDLWRSPIASGRRATLGAL